MSSDAAPDRVVSWPRSVGELLLRRPIPADFDELLRWRNSPAVGHWLIHTRADPDAMLAQLREPTDPDDHGCVVLLDGAVVGAGYLEFRDGLGQDGLGQDGGPATRRCEALLGWNLAPAVWGRGYGTAVARELLTIAFDDLGVRRVTAGCFADNTASWRIMERIGMRREQHGIEDSWHADLGWVDGYTYALLRSEWVARRR